VLGISVDPQPAKTAWAKEIGVKSFDLLSDNYPYGEVAKKYGVFREQDGISERAVFVIDKSGKVTWSKVYDIPHQPANAEIFEALAALGRA
jgi:peroxiredoxin